MWKGVLLLVEDNPNTQIAMRRLLEKEEFDMITADDEAIALDLLGEVRPSVIVTDVSEPKSSHRTMIQQIRVKQGTENIPVVALVDEDSAALQQAAEAGATAIVQKSSDMSRLVDIVNHVVLARRTTPADIAQTRCLDAA